MAESSMFRHAVTWTRANPAGQLAADPGGRAGADLCAGMTHSG